MDEEDRKAGRALRALEEWCRKHYRASLSLGPSVMPGDEGFVELTAAGRKVVVDIFDCNKYDEAMEEITHYGDAADAITEALRRWHADNTLKWFKVCLDWKPGFEPVYPEGALVRDFGISKFDGNRSSWVTVQFHNEAEALAWAEVAVPSNQRCRKSKPYVSEVGVKYAEWTRQYIANTNGKG
jgi:hypothetical protein